MQSNSKILLPLNHTVPYGFAHLAEKLVKKKKTSNTTNSNNLTTVPIEKLQIKATKNYLYLNLYFLYHFLFHRWF